MLYGYTSFVPVFNACKGGGSAMGNWLSAGEWAILIIGIAIIAACIAVPLVCCSPFKYPYDNIYIDISGKRNQQMDNLIDRYLIQNGLTSFYEHCKKVENWKTECQSRIDRAILKKYRNKQFLSCVDDENMFVFIATRSQKRYRQQNYVRSAYRVDVVSGVFSCELSYLERRYQQLAKIGFECTLSEYEAKDQRKRMTKALREEIAKRDNYTCQICGKYMPDGVGLHVDHIIPIAKGGKTVPSNLQVLCSKCNGKKSQKIV